ncbi:dTDP-4-dehydrorhamnose 3,5-epimerase [Sphingomonas sp. MM-1]|uniref:dTDP-4-dehydrorhamnose 3,5-epimerase n=1 Tax=Sphingomonas sp. MM-1 TaxID=745310 RepID=UPI0002C0A611|nr:MULTISPECIES: dTDP-4-dehydrorhamnose 3,5-epimerase [unclassified Sphingomonas]AGH48400.1 dTDP-4-dehydrorhamnose 3,5-epimerase [Sphingomonas sp. MM-1]MDX3883420.1 dTDP-4-dehydrorhamnose 3,5-epimerase [Sphingomonas sp.]
MIVTDLDLPGLKLFDLDRFGDDRGFFLESWNQRRFADAGFSESFVQDNHSRSAAGVLRGLHYQLKNPQGKLVRVTRGRAYDVVVDLRRSSPTFGRWQAVPLSEDEPRLFWIPPGFAHGFLALEDRTEFQYKVTTFYDPADEHSLLWNDPAIGIAWPLEMEPALSAKDAAGLPLADAPTYA